MEGGIGRDLSCGMSRYTNLKELTFRLLTHLPHLDLSPIQSDCRSVGTIGINTCTCQVRPSTPICGICFSLRPPSPTSSRALHVVLEYGFYFDANTFISEFRFCLRCRETFDLMRRLLIYNTRSLPGVRMRSPAAYALHLSYLPPYWQILSVHQCSTNMVKFTY